MVDGSPGPIGPRLSAWTTTGRLPERRQRTARFWRTRSRRPRIQSSGDDRFGTNASASPALITSVGESDGPVPEQQRRKPDRCQSRCLQAARSGRASETFQLARPSTVLQCSGPHAGRFADCRSVNVGHAERMRTGKRATRLGRLTTAQASPVDMQPTVTVVRIQGGSGTSNSSGFHQPM